MLQQQISMMKQTVQDHIQALQNQTSESDSFRAQFLDQLHSFEDETRTRILDYQRTIYQQANDINFLKRSVPTSDEAMYSKSVHTAPIYRSNINAIEVRIAGVDHSLASLHDKLSDMTQNMTTYQMNLDQKLTQQQQPAYTNTTNSANVVDAAPAVDTTTPDNTLMEHLVDLSNRLNLVQTNVESIRSSQMLLTPLPEAIATHLASAEVTERLDLITHEIQEVKASQALITTGMTETLPEQLNSFVGQVTKALESLAAAPQSQVQNNAISET